MIFRIEADVNSGVSVQIEQKAYKNDNGDVLVIDASEVAPEGFIEFDPYAAEVQPL